MAIVNIDSKYIHTDHFVRVYDLFAGEYMAPEYKVHDYDKPWIFTRVDLYKYSMPELKCLIEMAENEKKSFSENQVESIDFAIKVMKHVFGLKLLGCKAA